MAVQNPNRVRLTSLRLPKAADVLASQIKQEIISGQYPEGAMLPHETEMAAQLGVSRPTVREALRLLEAEDLISIRAGPRGGPRVERPNVLTVTRSMTTLFQYERVTLAELIEARRARETDVEALRRAVEQMAAALNDDGVFWTENANFHVALVQAARNLVLQTLMEALRDLIYQFTAGMHIESEERADTLAAHTAIMEAIAAHDPQCAYQATVAHLDHFVARLQEYYPDLRAIGLNPLRPVRPANGPANGDA